MKNRTFPWIILRIILGGQLLVGVLFNGIKWKDSVYFTSMLTGPDLAPLFTLGAFALLLTAGISIVFDYKVKLGCIALLVFLVPATYMHFLAAQQAVELANQAGAETANGILNQVRDLAYRGQISNVGKNFVLASVALLFFFHGTGPSKQ